MWQLHTESCGKWRVNHPQWELWFAISPSWVWREKITWGIWQAEDLSMCIIIFSTIVAIIRPISSHNSWTCLEIPIYIYIYYIAYIYISHYITIKWLMNGMFPLPPLCGLYILFSFPFYQRKHSSWWPEILSHVSHISSPSRHHFASSNHPNECHATLVGPQGATCRSVSLDVLNMTGAPKSLAKLVQLQFYLWVD